MLFKLFGILLFAAAVSCTLKTRIFLKIHYTIRQMEDGDITVSETKRRADFTVKTRTNGSKDFETSFRMISGVELQIRGYDTVETVELCSDSSKSNTEKKHVIKGPIKVQDFLYFRISSKFQNEHQGKMEELTGSEVTVFYLLKGDATLNSLRMKLIVDSIAKTLYFVLLSPTLEEFDKFVKMKVAGRTEVELKTPKTYPILSAKTWEYGLPADLTFQPRAAQRNPEVITNSRFKILTEVLNSLLPNAQGGSKKPALNMVNYFWTNIFFMKTAEIVDTVEKY